MKGAPLSRHEIERLKRAAEGLGGERGQEMIALAALQYFELKEITVFDISGTQEYFRLGNKGRHGIQGVHVHMPYGRWDPVKGWSAGPTKAAQNNVVGLVGDVRRIGTVDMYVGELLKALEQGRYEVGFVDG
jgi:hypothetical protein